MRAKPQLLKLVKSTQKIVTPKPEGTSAPIKKPVSTITSAKK